MLPWPYLASPDKVNPELQTHSKLPSKLVHTPFLSGKEWSQYRVNLDVETQIQRILKDAYRQIPGFSLHSSTSEQVSPLGSSLYPSGHSHRKLPGVLTHWAKPWHPRDRPRLKSIPRWLTNTIFLLFNSEKQRVLPAQKETTHCSSGSDNIGGCEVDDTGFFLDRELIVFLKILMAKIPHAHFP